MRHSGRVRLIDPQLSEDPVTILPWFGDLATFEVDLLFHGHPNHSSVDRVRDQLSDEDQSVFRAVSVVKTLVRRRFAEYERKAAAEDWRLQQNLLVCAHAEALAL